MAATTDKRRDEYRMKKLMNKTALLATAFALALAFALMIALGGSETATAQTATATPTATDYDSDNDGLIEIKTHQQLNAMRHDPNGFGNSSNSVYTAAFPNAGFGMGCPIDLSLSSIPKCEGYELAADIPLSAYSNWTPIPAWSATFNGNGYNISDMTTTGAGLFASINSNGTVRNAGLMNATVTRGKADGQAGALAGINRGMIETSYATGAISYANTDAQDKREVRAQVGGLVGSNKTTSHTDGTIIIGAIIASWADVGVSIRGSGVRAGGFAGDNKGRIVSSYSYGDVEVADVTGHKDGSAGYSRVGGFVAVNNGLGKIISSYSLGSVTAPGTNNFGSFVHAYQHRHADALIADSYWDRDKSGLTHDNNGGGCAFPNSKTTAELREIKRTGADPICPSYENRHRYPPTPTPAPTPTQ